jgi:hypothetical protein
MAHEKKRERREEQVRSSKDRERREREMREAGAGVGEADGVFAGF